MRLTVLICCHVQTLGKDPIGRGQYGVVYKALEMKTGQTLAVKVIPFKGRDPEEARLLFQEVSMLKCLSHPSVTRYVGAARVEHLLCIVTEFVENGSLDKMLRSFGSFEEPLTATYTLKILDGLRYLHEAGVIHCDLKAANILTTKSGNIKLTDFGVSRYVVSSSSQSGNAIGTPFWMAPEIVQLKGPTTASDIWSLGCSVIEMLTGRPPYAKFESMHALYRIVTDPHPPLPSNLTEDCVDLLLACFRKEPNDRPDASELSVHPWLDQVWDGDPTLAQESLPALHRISIEARRLSQTTFTAPAIPESPADPPSSQHLSMAGNIKPEDSSASSAQPNCHAGNSRLRLASNASTPPVTTVQPRHNFIRSVFGQALACSVCGADILPMSDAFLCSAKCSMVCHRRCVTQAPLPCVPIIPSFQTGASVTQLTSLTQHTVPKQGSDGVASAHRHRHRSTHSRHHLPVRELYCQGDSPDPEPRERGLFKHVSMGATYSEASTLHTAQHDLHRARSSTQRPTSWALPSSDPRRRNRRQSDTAFGLSRPRHHLRKWRRSHMKDADAEDKLRPITTPPTPTGRGPSGSAGDCIIV